MSAAHTAARLLSISVALSLILSAFTLQTPASGDAGEEIVLRCCLFKGFHEGYQPGPRPKIGAADERISLPVRYAPGTLDSFDVEDLKEAIRDVYRIPYPILLTSTNVIWDGRGEAVYETAMDEHDIYPIRISPKILARDSLSLRIDAFTHEFQTISFWSEISRLHRAITYKGGFELFVNAPDFTNALGGGPWLEGEFVAPLGTPILMELPKEDRSLFLSIQGVRRDDRRMDVGLVGNRILSCSVGGTDPVCGKKVGQGDDYGPADSPKAFRDYGGRRYFFCSEDCRSKFDADPARYLAKINDYLKRVEVVKKKRRDDAFPAGMAFPPRPRAFVVPRLLAADLHAKPEGGMHAELDVDETGNLRDVRILNSDISGLDEPVREALRQWIYDPAIRGKELSPLVHSVDVRVGPQEDRNADQHPARHEAASAGVAMMEKIADYVSRLDNAALDFVCRETITERLEKSRDRMKLMGRLGDPFAGPGGAFLMSESQIREDASFHYDYQLIRTAGQIRERRIPLEEDRQRGSSAKAYPATHRFYVDKAVYGPIGLLGREAQSRYRYALLKEEKAEGRPAYVIEVRSDDSSSGGAVRGTAWIDEMDGAVLKMDIDAASLSGYERLAADYVSRGVEPVISIEVLFGFEKNGLRFPSRVTLKEAYSDPDEGRTKMSQLTASYDRYKFFTVGTEVKY